VATRLGVDVGGTFTDLVFFDDESGVFRVGKEPTTPEAPEDGVLASIGASVPEDGVTAARYFLHGTTVGLNSLLTRTGAVVGLLATRGFRDVLEIARGDRRDPYDLFWRQPPPLVPRYLRLPVTERISARGEVLVPLEEADIRAAFDVFAAEGVNSIAIAFMNAYANPAHELAAMSALRDLGFDAEVSLSHRVSGEYREYERTSTTVIDAYVRPRMRRYFRALERRLEAADFAGTPIVTRSGGGALTFSEAEERPFETILSGPVAGVEAGAELARRLGLGAVITADVGGTSFDTSLIIDGAPQLMFQGEVEGMPVQAPWVDVRSIGAGGGSIAEVDVGGLLKVGPASAGAVPGPACYGRGGELPTVTDAAFLLGMLGGGALASGIVLDREEAASAIAPLADRLGYDVEQAARGIMTIAAASMAGAIRAITIERGHDPRDAVLMPFGGAGPLFATLLARELEIDRIVVPPFPGNFSAWGVLTADLVRSTSRTRILPLEDEALATANGIVVELLDELSQRTTSPRDAEPEPEVALDMRFVGQEHSLTVPVSRGLGIATAAEELRSQFLTAYEQTFGHVIDERVQIVAVRLTLRTRLPRIPASAVSSKTPAADGAVLLPGWSFARGEMLPFRLLARDAVTERIAGPAILLEPTATTYLDAGFEASAGAEGELSITPERGG
jgi:N-methylhydantoinase A